jgi:hypothetical protein
MEGKGWASPTRLSPHAALDNSEDVKEACFVTGTIKVIILAVKPVLWIRVPLPFCPLDPGSRMVKNQDPDPG